MTTALVIITSAFPFDGSSDFLEDEIEWLAAAFDSVTLVPLVPTGQRLPVPANVDVDLRVAARLTTRTKRVASAFRFRQSRALLSEALRSGGFPPTAGSWLRLLAAIGIAEQVRRWGLDKTGLRPDVVLNVWAGPAVIGMASSGHLTVTRAHGGDLYADRHPGDYMPLQREIVAAADAIHPVSEDGVAYIRRRFPEAAPRTSARRLGVRGAATVTPASTDGRLRIVSCSALLHVKRPSLLALIIDAIGRRHTDVQWDHFGSGPLEPELRRAVAAFGPTVQCSLHGRVPNRSVIEHYERHPVDVFLNTSSSEGVPVSMMEAMSAGIPILAPAVGGIHEIVRPDNGQLFSPDAEAHDVAEQLLALHARTPPFDRGAIRASWELLFSAATNYESFATELLEHAHVRQNTASLATRAAGKKQAQGEGAA